MQLRTAPLESLAALEDRIAIQDVICAMTLYADMGEPERSLECFSDDAVMDYSALYGEGSQCVSVKEHRCRVQRFLPGFDSCHHQITNFDIAVHGSEATSRSQVSAIHRLGDAVWSDYGTYRHRLIRTTTGWKIASQHVQVAYQAGAHLIEAARLRVAGGIKT